MSERPPDVPAPAGEAPEGPWVCSPQFHEGDPLDLWFVHEPGPNRPNKIASCLGRQRAEQVRDALNAVAAGVSGAPAGEAPRALLQEWLDTPFFERREDWEAWVGDFGARVRSALAVTGARTERMDLHDELDRRFPSIGAFQSFVAGASGAPGRDATGEQSEIAALVAEARKEAAFHDGYAKGLPPGYAAWHLRFASLLDRLVTALLGASHGLPAPPSATDLAQLFSQYEAEAQHSFAAEPYDFARWLAARLADGLPAPPQASDPLRIAARAVLWAAESYADDGPYLRPDMKGAALDAALAQLRAALGGLPAAPPEEPLSVAQLANLLNTQGSPISAGASVGPVDERGWFIGESDLRYLIYALPRVRLVVAPRGLPAAPPEGPFTGEAPGADLRRPASRS